VTLSPRTIMELAGSALLGGLLIWQALVGAALRTEVARLQTAQQADQLVIQAKDATAKSCQAALDSSGAATRALADATDALQGLAGTALQKAQDRNQTAALDIARLLSVRPAAGMDCQTATGLARAAWEEGQ